MDIDNTVVQTLVALFPGVLASLSYSRLRATKQTQLWIAVVEFVVFAFVSYAIASPIVRALGLPAASTSGSVDVTLTQAAFIRNWYEFYAACIVGLLLSVVAAVFHNHKIINRLARRVRITSSFGDDDVWQYIHNSPNVEWVFVRDTKENIVYYGKISQYSDPYRPRELLLTDVEVYPNVSPDGRGDLEPIQTLDAVYLSRPNDAWTIEIPALSNTLPATVAPAIGAAVLRSGRDQERRWFLRCYSRSAGTGPWELKRQPGERHRRGLSVLLTSLASVGDTGGEDENG
ncbi:MAG: hypothetical protein EA382_14795 [Spirochaetaceae bacterium]|nr:MAG: hypothetical protein EA382_14795 [Spirochaetaceae bacterium]